MWPKNIAAIGFIMLTEFMDGLDQNDNNAVISGTAVSSVLGDADIALVEAFVRKMHHSCDVEASE